jgi:hypothetical protein
MKTRTVGLGIAAVLLSCHEGNDGLRNMLSAARSEEAAEDER